MIHTLKIWPEYFEAILDGRKTWEYRKNDRNYQLNDVLRLHEWNNTMQKFTGRMMVVTVTYIYYTPSNTQEYCIMSIVPELEGK
jgi:ASC-1-like (ASCH) protein